MSSRFLIPVLCVGAVAFACGPRAHNEASAPRKNSASATTRVAASQAIAQQGTMRPQMKSSKAPLTAQLSVHTGETNVRLALHVVNTTKKRLELTFPSGQTYDFVILDSVGRELWRWGSGRMFTQALRNKLLAGGEAINVEETWESASLAPGRYTARALLKSENYPVRQETEFTIEGTTVASR